MATFIAASCFHELNVGRNLIENTYFLYINYYTYHGGSYGLNIGGAQRKILGVHRPFEPILLGVHNLINPLESSIIGGAQAPPAPPITTSLL